MGFKDVSPEIASIAENYHSQKVPPWLSRLQELAQQLWQYIQDLFDWLLKHRGPGASDSHGLSTLMQLALYLAGFIALLSIGYLLWQRSLARKAVLSATRRGATEIAEILTSDGYKLEAVRLAEKHDFRGACRALYLSLLQVFHEEEIANFSPAKTNYEYRYLLAKYPPLKDKFVEFAEIVEEIWFGNRRAESQDYQSCKTLLESSAAEALSLSSKRNEQSGASE